MSTATDTCWADPLSRKERAELAPHWRMIPAAIRTAVWNAWDEGRGAGSPQHRAAITAAIRSVNEQLARAGS